MLLKILLAFPYLDDQSLNIKCKFMLMVLKQRKSVLLRYMFKVVQYCFKKQGLALYIIYKKVCNELLTWKIYNLLLRHSCERTQSTTYLRNIFTFLTI